MPPIYIVTDVTTAMHVLSVCVCVTLLHPAKAIGWNEMPFGRDTHVVPGNIVLDRGPVPTGRGDLGDQNPRSQRCRLLQNYFGPC